MCIKKIIEGLKKIQKKFIVEADDIEDERAEEIQNTIYILEDIDEDWED